MVDTSYHISLKEDQIYMHEQIFRIRDRYWLRHRTASSVLSNHRLGGFWRHQCDGLNKTTRVPLLVWDFISFGHVIDPNSTHCLPRTAAYDETGIRLEMDNTSQSSIWIQYLFCRLNIDTQHPRCNLGTIYVTLPSTYSNTMKNTMFRRPGVNYYLDKLQCFYSHIRRFLLSTSLDGLHCLWVNGCRILSVGRLLGWTNQLYSG